MLIPILSKYLSVHKRLVVPQLGAFLVKEPGVSVVFSELMKRDDGVLRSLLREQGLGEVEAAGEIDRFVFEVRHAVEHGEEVTLEGLGLMRSGPNGTVAFEYIPAPEQDIAPEEVEVCEQQSTTDARDATTPMHAEKVAETTQPISPEEDPHMTVSPKMNPEPYVRGLRYGKPLKTTDAYRYVDRAPRRRIDRFLLVAILAAAIAVAAIVYGYWREAREKQAEQQAQQPIEQTAPDATPAEAHPNTPTE